MSELLIYVIGAMGISTVALYFMVKRYKAKAKMLEEINDAYETRVYHDKKIQEAARKRESGRSKRVKSAVAEIEDNEFDDFYYVSSGRDDNEPDRRVSNSGHSSYDDSSNSSYSGGYSSESSSSDSSGGGYSD